MCCGGASKYNFCLLMLKVTECLIGRARLASLFPMSCNRCDAPPRVHWLPKTRGSQAQLLGLFLGIPGAQGVIEVVGKGAVKNITRSMDARMGGRKHVTHLMHMESFGLSADELGAALQRKFKTSCSVAKLPGKTETGKEISLQGNLLQVDTLN